MESLSRDLKFALRQLRKSPGFTLTAVLTLTLGLGATAAVYSVIHSVLLLPLPYPNPDRVVGVAFTFPQEKPNAEQTGGSADFIREHSEEFSSLAVMDDSGPAVNLSVDGSHAEQINALRVSEGYFRTLGVMPTLGRDFLAQEDRPGGGRAAVLSAGLWTRVFDRDPHIVGRSIRLNQESFTIVGVMPANFAVISETAPGVMGTPDVWEPLQLSPKDPGYNGDNYEMIARLRPDITLAQVRQKLTALEQPFYREFPAYKRWTAPDKSLHLFRTWKLQDVVVSDVRQSLLTMMGAVVAVLLVACLNLAGLTMARTMRRSREIALRSALGATRRQLLRLLFCEGLLLASGGGILALLVARVATDVLLHASPLAIPDLHGKLSTGLFATVVLLLAFATLGIFSLLPASAILRQRSRDLRLGGPTLGETLSHARLSRALVVTQVALAMVLVSTASMLLGTFVKLRSLPPGCSPGSLQCFKWR